MRRVQSNRQLRQGMKAMPPVRSIDGELGYGIMFLLVVAFIAGCDVPAAMDSLPDSQNQTTENAPATTDSAKNDKPATVTLYLAGMNRELKIL